jgi:hypothetical protein
MPPPYKIHTLYRNYFKLKDSDLSSEVSNSIRNWIVMVDSQEMNDLFPEEDWVAILEQVKPLPLVDNCYGGVYLTRPCRFFHRYGDR